MTAEKMPDREWALRKLHEEISTGALIYGAAANMLIGMAGLRWEAFWADFNFAPARLLRTIEARLEETPSHD